MGGIFFWGGGPLTPFFFCENLLVRVKLGNPPEYQLPRQTPFGRKVCGSKERKKEERKRKNNAKFSGHYVCPRVYVRTNFTDLASKYDEIFPCYTLICELYLLFGASYYNRFFLGFV